VNPVRDSASCWPTKEQELLLRASLLPGREAVDAWQGWGSSADIDLLDQGSFRLLPLLYRNLSRHEVKEPLLGRLKGVYRATWYKNQMLFHTAAGFLRSLHRAGIPVMILKGAALATMYYRDAGLRAMDDFDFLVPTEQALQAIDLLVGLGWKPVPWRQTFNEEYLTVLHAHQFNDGTGYGFDLHWHMLSDGCYAGADEDFWNGAIRTEIHDAPVYALNAADELLHTCVHGTRWSPVPPLRWLADAMIIVRDAQSEIDWSRLVWLAQGRRLILPVRQTLDYLRTKLDAPIPPSVLEDFQQAPVSRAEYTEHERITRSPGLLGQLPAKWYRYRRSVWGSGHSLTPIKVFGFLRYLQRFWDKDHLGQVLWGVVQRGISNILATARSNGKAVEESS
jgi:hypothetical protein